MNEEFNNENKENTSNEVKEEVIENTKNETIEQINDRIKVTFDEPQKAVTPGQSAVFYKGDVVIGGGKIL